MIFFIFLKKKRENNNNNETTIYSKYKNLIMRNKRANTEYITHKT